MSGNGKGIGAPVPRVEDHRFLTGRGRFTDDLNLPRQTHMAVVRSPEAHANIRGIDSAAAKAAPGVVAVFTGKDLEADGVKPLPTAWLIHSKDGSPMVEPGRPVIAVDRVRHVGDAVAVVIAETKAQARAAARLVAVDYEPLPAVPTIRQAIADGAPRVWEQAPGNVCFDWEVGDEAATEAAFAGAAHVVSLDLENQRLVPNAIEPRAALGSYDPSSDRYTLHKSSQNPHVDRLILCAFVFGWPDNRLRVVAPDVGGGFGSKIYQYPEDVIVTWAAGKIGRPVKWTAERSESFMTDSHGRDHVSRIELALDEDGRFVGLRSTTHANVGAYLTLFGTVTPTYLHGILFAGCYTTPAIYVNVKAVFTNTAPVDALRGAGRPEATFQIERIVDVAARELGMDPIELRRKNFITEFPYQTPVALQYDSGDYHATLDLALEASRYDEFEARRAEAKARGKLRGIGVSTFLEACGVAPSAVVGSLGARAGLYEAGQIRVHPTGSVTAYTGSHAQGQGHETTFAQIVSDLLGVPFEQVQIRHGDTDEVSFGMGTYGSRSLAVGGSALARAAEKVIAKGKRIAAHLLEAAVEDIEFEDGSFKVAGTDRSKSFAEIALAAYVPHNYPSDLEPGLDEIAFFDPLNFTFPAGCHVAEVEIDPETGVVELVQVTGSDDVGTVINPMVVDGQLQGGMTHGIGQALFEACRYDESGQLLTGSFMSYGMPRAADVPFFVHRHCVTATKDNPLGAKGVGEVGAIGVCPAVINAVVDALRDHGVRHIDMPATPEKVWRAIQADA